MCHLNDSFFSFIQPAMPPPCHSYDHISSFDQAHHAFVLRSYSVSLPSLLFIDADYIRPMQYPIEHHRLIAPPMMIAHPQAFWHPMQAHTRMDSEVVYTLLGLLDQRITEDFPGQILQVRSSAMPCTFPKA